MRPWCASRRVACGGRGAPRRCQARLAVPGVRNRPKAGASPKRGEAHLQRPAVSPRARVHDDQAVERRLDAAQAREANLGAAARERPRGIGRLRLGLDGPARRHAPALPPSSPCAAAQQQPARPAPAGSAARASAARGAACRPCTAKRTRSPSVQPSAERAFSGAAPRLSPPSAMLSAIGGGEPVCGRLVPPATSRASLDALSVPDGRLESRRGSRAARHGHTAVGAAAGGRSARRMRFERSRRVRQRPPRTARRRSRQNNRRRGLVADRVRFSQLLRLPRALCAA
jgi:hypothetical protein